MDTQILFPSMTSLKYPVKSAHTNRYRPHCTVFSLVLQIKSFVLLFSNFKPSRGKKKKDRVVVLKNSREHDWVAKWLDEIDLWIDKVALCLIIILVYEFGPAQYKVFSVTLKQNKRSPESENKKNQTHLMQVTRQLWICWYKDRTTRSWKSMHHSSFTILSPV